MAEVEKNVVAHEATMSSAPATTPIPAGPNSKVSDGEANPDRKEMTLEEMNPGRLTPEKLAEKAKKYSKKTGKTEKEAAKEPIPLPVTPKEPVPGVPEKAAAETSKTTEFKPNPKFKAADKEYDLPKWALGAITTPELEHEVKDVFSKVQAFDHMKARHTELYQKHSELDNSHKELTGGIQELRTIYQQASGSGQLLLLDDFFNKLKIDPQVIMGYALQKARFLELPMDQQQMVQSQFEVQRRARELEHANQNLSNNATTAETRMMGLLLEAGLAKTEIAPLVQAFDSAPGRKQGDFRQRVIDHGDYIGFKSGGKTVLTPEQAIKAVIEAYGLTGNMAAPGTQASAPAATQTPATPVIPVASPHRNVPVIPSIASKSTSPMKNKPKSIADLRKIAKDMASTG